MKELFMSAGKFFAAAGSKKSGKGAPTSSSATDLAKAMSGLPVHVVSGVTDLVGQVTDYLKIAEQEQTRRTDIIAKRDVALAAMQHQREIMSEMIRFTFQERAAVLQKQFQALDQALAENRPELVNAALNSMVNVIQSSPFKSVQEMQQALGTKDFVIRLE
ncbi:hypothetical protein [Pseudomonas flexibilis]|uniref:Uncharacterized protein n=1 Tax=Pseudomonas flexibilis TaxID=706570 RepID=A0A0B3BSD8_9PSED|nr:hypothetical protein [Pseudomonas flexibilis]KHO63569.1 hypothetical protein PT85_16595 [Pseudomonas flexibilis]SCY56203.1 hypothetical protein SAMN02927929_03312 [Pseudomonas flexibilis]